MIFSVGCELNYSATQNTTLILNVEVQKTGRQEVLSERFSITPDVGGESYTMTETGNRYRRLVLPVGRFAVRYEAEVRMTPVMNAPGTVDEIPVSQLPLEVMAHLFPSRYCPSDLLMRFAWRTFGDIASGHEKVTAICNWIYDNVDYLAGSSVGSTTAHDTFTTRAGVCRDFAHLGITLCRALGIPARYVSAFGYKLFPQDFHAVFEAFVGGRWFLFDPTRLSPADGLIRIGVGRDAADTAFATYFGALASEPKTVWVEAADQTADGAPWTTEAVSISSR